MSENLGTENIEKVLSSALKLSVIAKKIAADGKVNKDDLAHLTPLVSQFKEHLEAGKSINEAFAEIKDLDVLEVTSLIVKIDGMVEQVEQA